jgi:hypothetical protein
MATVRIDFDAEALRRLDGRVRLLTDQNLRYVASKALNGAADAAKASLRESMPRYIDKPVPYTLNSGFQRFARAENLEAVVGIADRSRSGRTPASKYLQPIVKGTTPSVKGADLSATKIAREAPGAVLVPAKNSPLRKTAAGNYTISAYAKVLGSARQGGDGRQYFIAPVKPGSSTKAIFTKAGRGGKELRRVFTIDPNPKQRRPQFPVREILTKAFGQAWPAEVRKAYQAEVQRKLGSR